MAFQPTAILAAYLQSLPCVKVGVYPPQKGTDNAILRPSSSLNIPTGQLFVFPRARCTHVTVNIRRRLDRLSSPSPSLETRASEAVPGGFYVHHEELYKERAGLRRIGRV
jgi:hypothetical protein